MNDLETWCSNCELKVEDPEELDERKWCGHCRMREENPLLVFDFFSGTGSSTQAFADNGDEVVSFELDPQFSATETISILDLTPEYLLKTYGRPDFIWASPPCTAFSVASIGHHWKQGGVYPIPKTQAAVDNQRLVEHTRMLIEAIKPRFGYLIENPRGMLRKLPAVRGLMRRTVTYCQYGDSRQKPTDLWGSVPNWRAKEPCRPGSPCHEAAPRGSRTGTQGLGKAKIRSMIPYGIGESIRNSILDARMDGRKFDWND
jgi:hypothetical protein